MLKYLTFCFFTACFPSLPAFACDQHRQPFEIASIEKYEIIIPQAIKDKIGLSRPGIGSGLTFKQRDSEGNFIFYSITDRGVNLSDAKLTDGQRAVMFPFPEFKPFVSEIKLTVGKGAEITAIYDLKLSGLPPKTKEALQPISANLDVLNFDPHGIDSEAIDFDRQGNFWIAEEYRPAILQFSPSGKKLRQIDVGDFLPEIKNFKMDNRGIESLVVTPNDKLVFAVESVLNIENKTKQTAEFIRVVEYDIKTAEFKVFAYAFDPTNYKNRANVKIGDIAAINDDNFLFIEQGMGESGDFINDIYLVSTKGATEISKLRHKNGTHLEYGPINNVIDFPLKKRKLLSMRDHDWSHEKLEGLTYIDQNTIAITNDNDFGIEPEFMGAKGAMIHDHEINPKEKTITKDGKKKKFSVHFHDNEAKKSEIWLIKLSNPILCD